MSRSVETIRDAFVVYFDATEITEYEGQFNEIVEDIQYAITRKYPSLDEREINKWVSYPYRENRIILENDHCNISISEYCGCGAISIFVDDACEYPELAEHWIEQVEDKIRKIIEGYVSTLIRIATFSNGEAAYLKKGDL